MAPKVSPSSGPPLYARVYQALRDEILSDRYPAGGLLPSECALERRFLVSRITIRRGLEELERAGLIERSQGRSATVLPRPAPIVADVTEAFAAHVAESADMRPRVLSFRWIRPEMDLAETLEVPPDSRVLWVTRLRRRHGQPVSHTSVHLPEHIGRELTEDLLGRLQLLDALKLHGHVADSAEQLLSAAPAPPKIAKHLDLAPGAPIFSMRRLMRDVGGRPMLLLHASMRWDRFSYRLSLRQTRPGAAASQSVVASAVAPAARIANEEDPIEALDFAL
ncbi:MAG: GntR family transcriptional regulator [Proteobacteria bacterium]|nr:GntR family transcriptional regulator [Pseudomonadota bacterium]